MKKLRESKISGVGVIVPDLDCLFQGFLLDKIHKAAVAGAFYFSQSTFPHRFKLFSRLYSSLKGQCRLVQSLKLSLFSVVEMVFRR